MPCHTEHSCENCSYISFKNEFSKKSFAELGKMADREIAEFKRNVEKQKSIIHSLRKDIKDREEIIEQLKSDIKALTKHIK